MSSSRPFFGFGRNSYIQITPWRAALVGCATLTTLLIWYWAILRWGTVGAPFIWWYTDPFPGPNIGPPPFNSGWKPKSRFVLSLTTMPHHLLLIEPTLQSLLAQSIKADAIYLNLPKGVNKRNNMSYDVSGFKVPEGVTINRCEDHGPLTKLLPTLSVETDPDTVIITVDDDKIYLPDTMLSLMWHAEHSKDVAFGVCGWAFMWVPRPMGVVPVYIPYFFRGTTGTMIDVLQACCGNAYRRSFFDAEKLAKIPEGCYTTDDLWIAGYLATQANVRRVIIPERQDPSQPDWKDSEPVQWRLSTVNSKSMKDIVCIDAVEKEYGTWPTVASY